MHKNGVFCSRPQLGSTVNSFIDLDEFEAIMTLSGCRALR